MARGNASAASSGGAVTDVVTSDLRRITLRHINAVLEDIGSLMEPKAGPRLIQTAAQMMTPTTTRFMSIDDTDRKQHIADRCDVLLLDAQVREIYGMLATDPQAGTTKTSALWCREVVYQALVELRSIWICLDIAKTNEAFEEWDALAAKTSASEKSVEEKGLKSIGEGAGLSWGTRKGIAQKAIKEQINKKGDKGAIITKPPVNLDKPDPAKPGVPGGKNRTPGATCSFCGKANHVDTQCHEKKKELAKEQARRRSRSPRHRRDRSASRKRRSPSRERKERRKDDRAGVKKESD